MIASRQRGMSMWSGLFVLGTISFFLFLTFKLLPAYSNDFKIKTAMDSIAREPGVGAATKAELIDRFAKRISIDNVDTLDLGKNLTVQTQGKTKTIRIAYEAVVPIAYNVSALIEFDHVRQVRSAE